MKRRPLLLAAALIALLLGAYGLGSGSRSEAPPRPTPETPPLPGEPASEPAVGTAESDSPTPDPSTATVLGELVRTDTGERVRGARVRLEVLGPGVPYRTVDLEADDGTFRAEGLPTGCSLRVRVAAEGFRPVIESRDPLPDPDEDVRHRIALRPRPGENRLVVPMRPAVPVRVRVVDGDGEPLPGRIVHVDDCAGWCIFEAAVPTGEDGVAAFGVPEGDDVHVWVEEGGHGMERDYGMYEAVAGDGLSVTLVLEYPDTGVRGRVVDPAGEPVAGVDVRIVDDDGDLEGSAWTNADGEFASRGFAPGSYDVVAYHPRHPPRVVPFTAVEGETVEVEVAFEKGRSIAGRVLRRDGSPAAGVGVRADVVLPRLGYVVRSGESSRTDEEGRFELPGLPEGSFDLTGSMEFEDGGRIYFDLAEDVPTGTRDLRCVLPREYLPVRGRVLIRGRAPDRPFAVVFLDEDGDRADRAEFVSADGRFTLSSFRPGSYRAVAYAEGYAPSPPVPFRVEAGSPAPEIALALEEPEAVVNVLVEDEGGRPIRGPRVRIGMAERPPGLDSREAYLDPYGRAVLARLPAGPAKLVLGEEETELTLSDLALAAGDRLDVDVVLRVNPVVCEVWDEESPFRDGDVVRTVGGVPVASAAEVVQAFDAAEPEASLVVTCDRGGRSVTVTLSTDSEWYQPAFRDDYALVRATVRRSPR